MEKRAAHKKNIQRRIKKLPVKPEKSTENRDGQQLNEEDIE